MNGECYFRRAQEMAKVKHELMVKNVGCEGLIIVDFIQRLGIEYAFREEIEQVLKRQYMAMDQLVKNKDLYFVSDCSGNTTTMCLQWAKLCNAFLEESKWFALGHLPKAEEYLNNGIISSGVHVALVHLFFLIGDGSTEERAEFMSSNASILSHPAAILRLWDDLGDAKDENQKGHDGSYVTCYMKEHEEVSVETARKHVRNLISDTWKRLNQESLSPNPYSNTFINGCLNLPRMVPLMYSFDDNQSLPLLEEYIKSVLNVDPNARLHEL